MARITVLGGTGYAGRAIVHEAKQRGHEVTSYSRGAPEQPLDGVTYVTESVLDPDVLAGAVRDADVVFETLSPRGEMEGRLEGVLDKLIGLCDEAQVRLGVLGGVSSVLVAPEGPRLFDVRPVPDEILPEVQTGLALLEMLKSAPEGLDWFYISPAAEFGGWGPSEVTGRYRTSDDVLLTDEQGKSSISAEDLALAVLDEIERPAHRRRRFHVAH